MADGKKISELTESATIEDAHYFAVSDGTDTTKVAYSTIKNDLVDYSEDMAEVISPTITATEIDGGHRLTIEDYNGTSTVNVMDGETGPRGPQGIPGPQGETGTFEDLTTAQVQELASYVVDDACVRAFDTVADMQAAADLKAGMVCHTNGFHASGDGGAAYYIISASGTANGMDVLTCANSLIATLVEGSVLVPEQYGANASVDCGSILTRMLSKNKKIVGGSDYLFESSVNIPASSDIYLKNVTYTGQDFCFIIGGHNSKLCVFRFISTTGGFVRNSATAAASRIEIMSIYCQAVGCFKIHSANNNSYSGWLIKGMRYYSYDANVPCVDIENNTGSYVNEIRFVDCSLFCASGGLAISAVGNNSAIQLVLERVDMESSGGIYLKNIQFLSMSNCRGGEIFNRADWLTIEDMQVSTGYIQMSNCTGFLRMQNVKFINSTTYVLLSGMKCITPSSVQFNGGRLYAAKFIPDTETILPVLLSEPIVEMPMYDTYLVPSMFAVNTTQAVTLDFTFPNYFTSTHPIFPTVVVRQASSNVTVNIWNNAGSSVLATYNLTDKGAYRFYRYYNQAWGCYMEKVS